MSGDLAHVLFRRAQFRQRFNFDQRTILKNATNAKFIEVVKTVFQRGCGKIAISDFHRGTSFRDSWAPPPPGRKRGF